MPGFNFIERILKKKPSEDRIVFACFNRPGNFNRSQFYPSAFFLNQTAVSWDPLSNKIQTVPIAAAPHVVETDPNNRQISYAVPRSCEIISVVDWAKNSEIAQIKLPNHHYCYGHGAFNFNSTFFLVSAVDVSATPIAGCLFLIDTITFQVLKKFEFPFGFAHDILNIDNDEFLVSCGKKNSFGHIVRFNLKTELYKELFVNTDGMGINLSSSSVVHFKRSGRLVYSNIQLINENRPGSMGRGGILRLNLENDALCFEMAPTFDFIDSEILSIEIDPLNNNLWGTLPAQKKVFVWNLEKHALLKVIDFKDMVTSISYIPHLKAMLCGQQGDFVFASCDNFALKNLPKERSIQQFSSLYFAHSRMV